MMEFCPFCETYSLHLWDSGNGYCYQCHNLYTTEQIQKKRESNQKFDTIILF